MPKIAAYVRKNRMGALDCVHKLIKQSLLQKNVSLVYKYTASK
ncbi:hypothetical protein HanHA300_Chr00c0324g0744331 [Helianthus annuus]|nr:hypothetical protein HanHA300_Chr00c0324g0744331 [Helianthus annuus]